MSQIQELHKQAMDLAEMAQVAKLRNNSDLAVQLGVKTRYAQNIARRKVL
ncbi:hypothetical protein WJM97_23405 (plasmid) [Okeanomitos corallinicola TIOX110]|uniref:DNA binding HTH domain-containing protein n=1 Tax=Okeanomitos corallinicola TIOX110 TaxID=3133117 RepID=A0ABZ2UZM4_9CYAN